MRSLIIASFLLCFVINIDITLGSRDVLLRSESTKVSTVNFTAACINFPCKTTKELFKSSGRYIITNNIATRLQMYKDCAYVAFQRYKPGVPMTLGVTCKTTSCGAVFDPFPCWTYQEVGNCDALQSVSDMVIDKNGIMWALDSGITESMTEPTRRCKPKIFVMNVNTKKVLRIINLDKLTVSNSRLQYLKVDYTRDGRCFVYVSDAATRSIIVYDVQAKRGYRLVLPKTVVQGCSKRDVLYLALITCNGKTKLYFTYLSAKKVYSIDAEHLHRGNTKGRIVEVGTKPEDMIWVGDDGCYIYFRYAAKSDVYRYDTSTCFKPNNFLLVFGSEAGLLTTHVAPDHQRNKMRALQSNFHDFIRNEVGCGVKHQISDIQGCYVQPN
uniref:CSON010498 protein n=1 Tax=Culicoides sonorensis TaxID=179676 RepID=A0A336MZ57_CULSO